MPAVQVRKDYALNVRRDFGVFGDGSDETTKIQAALDYGKADGRSVFLPDPVGFYQVSNLTVDFSGNTQASSGPPYGFQAPSIFGGGRRTCVIQQKSGSTGPVISYSGVQGSETGPANNRKVSGFTVADVEIVGTSGSTNHAIQVRNFIDVSLRDLMIRSCGGSGIKLVRDYFVTGTEEYGHGINISNTKIVACSRYGVEGSSTSWGGAGTGTGAAALSGMFNTVEVAACTLGGYYLNPASMTMIDCRAFQCGGPGFQTFRNPNQDSQNFSFNLVGCRSEGNCTSTGSYEVKIDGGCSGSTLTGMTVLATDPRGPHCIGVGNDAVGPTHYIHRAMVNGGMFVGNGATSGQKILVTGSDSRGLMVFNPRAEFTTFAGSPTQISDLVTDGGVQTTVMDTANFGWSPSGYLSFRREIATPGVALADSARVYIKDNGSGKTQLAVRFQSGAEQIIATEP